MLKFTHICFFRLHDIFLLHDEINGNISTYTRPVYRTLTDWPSPVIRGDHVDSIDEVVPELLSTVWLGEASGDSGNDNFFLHSDERGFLLGVRWRRVLEWSTKSCDKISWKWGRDPLIEADMLPHAPKPNVRLALERSRPSSLNWMARSRVSSPCLLVLYPMKPALCNLQCKS